MKGDLSKILLACFVIGFMVTSGFVPLYHQGFLENTSGQQVFAPSDPPIRINGDSDFTSSPAVSSGNGSADNPYVITYQYINGSGHGYGIYIGNTTKYFIIDHCDIEGARGPSGWFYWQTGIALYNVANGLIKNCNVSYCNGSGIRLDASDNNTVLRNGLYKNFGEGIRLDHSDDNIVESNNLTYNNRHSVGYFSGIYLEYSYRNNLRYNDANHNTRIGIRLTESDDNILENNNASRNGNGAGIYLQAAHDNQLYNNTVSNGSGEGIYFGTSNGNYLYNNTIHDNKNTNVYMLGCDGNELDNNSVLRSKSNRGIYIHQTSSFNSITNNTVGYNKGEGIYIVSTNFVANNNTVYNNDIFWNQLSGINIYWTRGNHILENRLWENNREPSLSHGGIKLENTRENNLENNTVSDNAIYGVYLYLSNDNYLFNNTIIKNYKGDAGLYLYGSHYNEVIHNNVSNNTDNGIYLSNSVHNLLDDNLVEYNCPDGGTAGIYMTGNGDNNTISNNTIENNIKNQGILINANAKNSVIKDNDIGYNDQEGILINSDDTISILNNNIYRNSWSGMKLFACKDFVVKDNTVWQNNQFKDWSMGGIELDQSTYNTLEDNYVHDNPIYGVILEGGSNNNDIIDNDILFNCGGEAGLYLVLSHYNEILLNNVSNSTGNGILLEASQYNLIDNNTVLGNNQDGTGMAGIAISTTSHNNTVTSNVVEDTIKGPGIGVWGASHYTTLAYNDVGYNGYSGIEIYSAASCSIHDNDLYWNYYSGLYLSSVKYAQIEDNEVWENNNVGNGMKGGIELSSSWENTIVDNYIHDNRKNGIILSGTSHKNVMESNDIISNCGGLAGINIYQGDENEILYNDIMNGTGVGVMLFSSSMYNIVDHNKIMGNNFSGVYMEKSGNNQVTNNTITGNSLFGTGFSSHGGIGLYDSPNVMIHDNVIEFNDMNGIYMVDSENTTISYNQINNNTENGIFYDLDQDAQDDYVNIHNNTIKGHKETGFSFLDGYHNVKYNYIAYNGKYGAYVESDSSVITYNTFHNNKGHGLYFDKATLNVIHHNNFVNNNKSYMQGRDDADKNFWDNGTEGNYWSDYESIYVPPAMHNGKVWDTPYNISGDGGNKDYYPLAKSLGIPGITDNTPTTGTTGDGFTFSCDTSTFIFMAGVYVYYWFGTNTGAAVNASMTETTTNSWELAITLPSDSVDPLKYYIHAFNMIGGNNSIGLKTVTITDNDPPTAAAGSDMQIDVGNPANFNGAGSTDNIDVVNYTWSFIYDGSPEQVYGVSTSFQFNIPGMYTVTLTVKDAAGLSDTDELIVTVKDDVKPTFLDVNYPVTVFIGDAFDILVNVTDLGGINVIKINYTDINGNNYYVTMSPGLTYDYEYTIPGQPTVGYVQFFIWVNDTYGNWQQTETYQIEVLDNIKPVIHNVLYPASVSIGTGIPVTVDATDNIAIENVKIYYTDVNGVDHSADMTKDASGNYTFTIPGQANEGIVEFYIYVIDTYGNWASTLNFTFDVYKPTVELTKPELEFVTLPTKAYVDDDIIIKVEVTDPAGVDKVYLNYTAVNNTVYNVTMSLTRGVYGFTIPGQSAVGNVKLFAIANNLQGIWNWTGLKTIIIAMVPPPIKDLYPPYVVSIDPPLNKSDVPLDTNVVIKFNESMNTTSVGSALDIMADLNYTYVLNYTLKWSDDNKTLTITFPGGLEPNTTYIITVGTDSKDLEGNRMLKKFISAFFTLKEAKPEPKKDSDGDGMDDDWEKENGLDPDDPSDAEKDSDGDGLSNKKEYDLGTEPDNRDTDGDGMPDGWEVDFGLDPKSDNSGKDTDGDGYSDLDEYKGNSDPTKSTSIPEEKKEEDGTDNTMLLLVLLIIVILVVALLAMFSRRKKPAAEAEEESEEAEEESEEEAEEEESEEAEEEAEEDEPEEDESEEADEEEADEEWEEDAEEEESEEAEEEPEEDDEDWDEWEEEKEDEEELDFDLTK